MKIIFVGGGGHFVPLLSVLQHLSKTDDVLIVGRKYALEGDKAISLEYKTSQDLDIPFQPITTGRLQRKFTARTLFSLLKIPYGVLQALSIIKKIKPDVVLSGGGYVAFPVGVACFFLGVPFVLHEQTQEAGLVNRITAFFAAKICISWESSRKFFPKEKTVLTGNPVRQFTGSLGEVRKKYSIVSENLPFLYITGGSLGSHAINLLIEGCLEDLLSHFRILHQTGDAKEYGDFDRLSQKREYLPPKLKDRYSLTKFVDPQDVGGVLQEATIVVGRCGINTISELLYYKKVSLLIPLPFSQGNEQYKNALLLKNTGLAEVLNQNDTTSELLFEKLLYIKKHILDFKEKNTQKELSLVTSAAENILNVMHSAVNKSSLPYENEQKAT